MCQSPKQQRLATAAAAGNAMASLFQFSAPSSSPLSSVALFAADNKLLSFLLFHTTKAYIQIYMYTILNWRAAGNDVKCQCV
jgi:hypothetical protein